MAWLVVQQTNSSLAVGLLVFFRVIPFLIFGPVVGTLIDRFPRIRVFRLTQIGMAAASLGFGVAIANGFSSLPVIYAYPTIVGTLLMAEIPSKRAYISGIVGPAALGSALALEMLSLNVAWFVGSNLGGVIAKLVDPSIAYIVIGAVFALNYRMLRGLPTMFHPGASLAAGGALKALTVSMAEGYRFARANNAIFAGLLVVGVNNFFGYAFESMAPAFARDIYRAGPTGVWPADVGAGTGRFRGGRLHDVQGAAHEESGPAINWLGDNPVDWQHRVLVYPDDRNRVPGHRWPGTCQPDLRYHAHSAYPAGIPTEYPRPDHGLPDPDDGTIPAWQPCYRADSRRYWPGAGRAVVCCRWNGVADTNLGEIPGPP